MAEAQRHAMMPNRSDIVTEKTKPSTVQGILGALVLLGGAWYFFGGGLEQHAAKEMVTIERQVAADTEAQYSIAKRSGQPMDACVHAGAVAAAYLQAKDEPQFKVWKQTEKVDCAAAGVSM